MIPQVEDNNAAEQCPVICHAPAVQHLDKAVPRIETDLEVAVDGPFFCDPDKTNRRSAAFPALDFASLLPHC